METVDAISAAIAASGHTSRHVSQLMGKSDSYISSVLASSKRKGGGVYSATLANVFDVCGYTLCAVPSDQVPDGALVIDPPSRGEA